MENQDNEEEEYIIETFEQMFDQIGYAHEAQYPSDLWYDEETGMGRFTVYKLTIMQEGQMEYKGQYTKFNTKLWPRIELLAKVMTNDASIKLFYLND